MADGPAGQEAHNDPEIEALLNFEPVPRKREVEGGWTAELQRAFITRLAAHGSATKACDELGKNQTGIMKLYRSPLGASFRESWDGAVALAKRRMAEAGRGMAVAPGTMPPTLDHRFRQPAMRSEQGPLDINGAPQEPGQILNHLGEWEDEESFYRHEEEAKDSIREKLVRIRRLYLKEISISPGKRAAFEILTELPIDWELAKEGEPQPHEPYMSTNLRQPDMVLTAESGWLHGPVGYGPDKIAQLRASVDQHRAELGLEPVDWESGVYPDDRDYEKAMGYGE